MEDSHHIQLAREILNTCSGSPLSSHEREKKAIELAAHMMSEAIKTETRDEKKRHEQLARLMSDPMGKAFTTAMTDECFRTQSPKRVADQMLHLLDIFGVPSYLPFAKQFQLKAFRVLGRKFARILVPMATYFLRKETSEVIIPGERAAFKKHIDKRRAEGVRLNINHLGEAILGEEEATDRLGVYLKTLASPDIEYVSIKISTIFSQINLVAHDETIEATAERLRQLYRAAMQNKYKHPDGTETIKFVNLDMEEYRDLDLTVDLFKKVLDEDEFFHFPAGIVLQAYLPDSHKFQKDLTEWAMERVAKGGAPIKVRLVKGANMALEKVESALHGWKAAPYSSKMHTDSNYKRMLHYGLERDHAQAVHFGIASHNLFDIAYAMILRLENGVQDFSSFEMLEGMASHMQRVVQKLTGSILLYCPVAKRKDFQSAIAYLIRRLDENTGPDNFLRHSFNLTPGTPEWDMQAQFFSEACREIDLVYMDPNRDQDRSVIPDQLKPGAPFKNDSETDFATRANRAWAHAIYEKWSKAEPVTIPNVINGREILHDQMSHQGIDPSHPDKPLYHYSRATDEETEEALACADSYKAPPLAERAKALRKAAQLIREKRAEFIGVMMADGGKTIVEADVELCEAIDFIDYYVIEMEKLIEHIDVQVEPRGTVVVTPPWNFPVSIPIGGIAAGLITGNSVIFKPSGEAVLCGQIIAKTFWEAGVDQKALQFLTCQNSSLLITDKRVDKVVLTGATATAQLFLKMRPDLHLSAETGGKNALIVSAMSDRDLAIKDIVRSAFGHAGQKCSACSLVILEKEVYDDPIFRRQLKDAVMSLHVGLAWDKDTFVTPLIHPPEEALMRGLTELDKGESWLVEPKCDPNNPHLWSPGVKWGVKPGSYSHRTEFFGPLISVIRANDLDHAIQIANDTPYGLTSGLHSLDDREQRKWQSAIVAGNCYINRGITGAIVRRQPFGGTKKSCFGPGRKAGGPHYLDSFMHISQVGIPREKFPVADWVDNLTGCLEQFDLSAEELGIWTASVSSYAFWWEHYKLPHDPSKLIGQDNYLLYRPHTKICARITSDCTPLDYMRIFAVALTAKVSLEVSWPKESDEFPPKRNWSVLLPHFNFVTETEEEFIKRVRGGEINRIRMTKEPSEAILKAAAENGCFIDDAPVLANGRFEMIRYLREISLSVDYHRYGNLGTRENEPRTQI